MSENLILETEKLISAHLDDLLSPEQGKRLESLAAESTDVAEELNAMKGIDRALRHYFNTLINF